ncbi:pantothenate kinase, putative [Plasmodium malariae]|uniref:Pantothenate kinase, putative n=1 Tax=Plasmodium malariae TaxID=5858 RepID=A0A1C3KF88_PLAMA|nr:pantothenate kinase, putative [Plasmodium malariae]
MSAHIRNSVLGNSNAELVKKRNAYMNNAHEYVENFGRRRYMYKLVNRSKGSVSESDITANSINGGSYNANSINGGSYNANSINGGSYNANSINGGSYNANSINGGSYNTSALDIGGTLIKVVYLNDQYVRAKSEEVSNEPLAIEIEENKHLYVNFFNIHDLEGTLDFLIKNDLIKKKIMLTGGGSHKYYYSIIDKIVKEEIRKRVKIANENYLLYVWNYSYDEEAFVLYVELCIEREDNNENKIIFNKEFLSKFKNYETIRVYLLKCITCNDKMDVSLEYNPNEVGYHSLHTNDDQREQIEASHYNRNVTNANNDNGIVRNINCVNGLSFKGDLIVECFRKDEMSCVMKGIYTLFNVKKSIVTYNSLLRTELPVQIKYPYSPFIIANIGSGISILKSNGHGCYKRISGTAIGGGTLMGIAQTILEKISFEQLIKLASKGTTNLDLKVKHMREDASGSTCINGHALATSFGNVQKILKKKKKKKGEEGEENYKNQEMNRDIARSLINMVSYNVGYLVCLLAKIHNVFRIFFSGKYVSNHECIMESLTNGVYYYYRYYGLNTTEVCDTPDDKQINNMRIRKDKDKDNARYDKKNAYKQVSPYSLYEVIFFLFFFFFKSNDDKTISTGQLPEVLFLKHDAFLGAIGCFFS